MRILLLTSPHVNLPGCCLEDFVRWHSPRDYVEGEGLSERMREPGNLWQQLWRESDARYGRAPPVE